MTEATQGYLGDKEMLADLLSTQRQVTSQYNTHAGECQCTDLRDTFLNILHEEHTIQSSLFNESHSRGWYPTREAPTAEINAARQMFMQ
jgi:hypothetical protein